MKKIYLSLLAISVILFIGCQQDNTDIVGKDSSATFSLSIANTRTSLGESNGSKYPVYWSESDCIAINGVQSESITIAEDRARAEFKLAKEVSAPYAVTYPYTATTTADAPKVVFPAEQVYVEGSFGTNCAPMCGYSSSSSVALKHLSGVLCFSVKASKAGVSLQKIVITSATEKIAGEFAVNCQSRALTPSESASNVITYTLPENFTLSTGDKSSALFVTIPAGDTGRCTIEFFDASGKEMVATWDNKSITAGVVYQFSPIEYKPGQTVLLKEFNVYYDFFCDSPVYGCVLDTNGTPIEGVVVSNGVDCVKTNSEGFYEITTDLSNEKFITISIPSGYKALSDSNGIPQFFHRVTEAEIKDNHCVANFILEPISGNPNRYTLIIGADPQPRAKSRSDDRIAFHSLDICEDLYCDMRETKATITDREVYGLMLGDIVHENMNLFKYYVAGVKSLGFQMFNIIGNHDHDLSATTDAEGARRFEENFGPTYYSFNIGEQHYVVLDNIIMTVVDGKLAKNEYTYGLSDEQWQWLQNDLSFVDKSTTLMVASHCPMFKKDGAESEYQDQSFHGADYANLLKQYSKVHAWAGHTHRSFNYNYPSSNDLKNIEVHTLARSTGEFWTNEYNAYGTPRGYTIVDVDGDNISWKFKPMTYQKAAFVGNSYSTIGTPAYTYRDWDYNDEGVAIMKKTGKQLDDSYQMQVWRDGNYVYVNVFLWDDKWEKPKFSGSSMTLLDRQHSNAVDIPYKELKTFYSANSILSGYDYSYSPYYHNSIFRVYKSGSTGSGTVSVKDRFGNTYTSDFSW